MQCPYPTAPDDDSSAWSLQLTSLRKDVECTFGILKKRFRILKLPQLWWSDNGRSTKLDNVFQACCVLHNMLLHVDGRDYVSAPSDHDPTRLNMEWPSSVERTERLVIAPDTDTGHVGPVVPHTAVEQDPEHFSLRAKLIRHFACWPRQSSWGHTNTNFSRRLAIQRASVFPWGRGGG
jgi:hypothetical protein